MTPPAVLRRVVVVVVLLLTAACAARPDDPARVAEVESELAALGVAVPEGATAALFGDDGGHLCAAAADPDALARTTLAGHRFALRRTAVDAADVTVARTVVKAWCPERLEAFDRYVDGLTTRGTAGG